MKALSIRQPWAALIVNGHKDIENRDWRTHFRGLVLIHAGLKTDAAALADVREGIHPVSGDIAPFDFDWNVLTGGIVGEAEIVDCVSDSSSPWFVGRYGFVLRNARLLPFMACKGALGLFEVQDEIVALAGAAP